MTIKLVEPNRNDKVSFMHYLMDYYFNSELYYYDKYKYAIINFDGYLKEINNLKYSIFTNPHYKVKTFTYWLKHDDKIVGVVRLRNKEYLHIGHIDYHIAPSYRKQGYGTILLNQTKLIALKLKYDHLIVSCHRNNVASKKIIIKNDGYYLNTVFVENEAEYYDRYQIDLT